MTPLLVLTLCLGVGDVEEEHADLKARLDAERTAFEALATDKRSLLTLVDTLERLSRDSSDRARRLQTLVARLDKRVDTAKQQEAATARAVSAQESALKPRLLAMYRLARRDRLGFLLESKDFATLMKRQRALKSLVAEDARALSSLAVVAEYRRLEARRLERLEQTGRRYLSALKNERAVGAARLTRFREVVTSVTAEQNRMSRIIAELEVSERELATMLGDLKSGRPLAGFRGRKGVLPYPTRGLVEVGFGKVVNPRFNTVTVQKGLDVRAALGTPVVAVGEGRVVFAGWLKGYGTLVIVDHGGDYHSLYAHLAASGVRVGDDLQEGQVLGTVGDTGSLKGAYLYFEIRKGGQAVDPLPWLKPEG